MVKSRLSEATVNNALGLLLYSKNKRWKDCIVSENTRVLSGEAGKRPDIIVNHKGGLPVIIESEFEPARTVEEDARSRLRKKLSADDRHVEQVIALKFPSGLEEVNQQDLEKELEKAEFRYAMFTANGLADVRWPEKGDIEGKIDDFVLFVEHTALSESIMTEGMGVLEDCISAAAYIIFRDNDPAVSTHTKLAVLLNQKEGEQTTRMAMAIMANAVWFHTKVSNLHGVTPFSELTTSQGRYSQFKVSDEWKRIYTEINYWPIFYIARMILNSLRTSIASNVLKILVKAATDLEGIGVTSQHDLSGRMLQRLIGDRKFLATFYTLPSSAALLSELAISRIKIDWSNKDEITKLQIGDFACGTGALLNASNSSVLARYRRTGGDDGELHAPLMENTLVGTDIMPAATHLTASILSSAQPEKPFRNTRIITLPYGCNKNASGETIDLGALDLINEEKVFSLFETSQDRVKGSVDGDAENVQIPHNSFDLVIMNPPFTRSSTHEHRNPDSVVASFAGFANTWEVQRLMGKKLRTFVNNNTAGVGNAGLASYFVDVANTKIKKDGTLALIIPFTFVNSQTWKKTRNLLEKCYRDIMIVSIASSGNKDRAFSADTGMAEVQVIATRSLGENTNKPMVTYINLTHRPSSIAEAGVIASKINAISASENSGLIEIGERQVGNFIRCDEGFSECAGISDVDIVNAATGFTKGKIVLPRYEGFAELPITSLSKLGYRGAHHAAIIYRRVKHTQSEMGVFTIKPIESIKSTAYPILWSHDHNKEKKFAVIPDSQGIIVEGKEHQGKRLWKKYAGSLCFNRNFRISSQPLAACVTTVKALGGQAWIGFICHDESHKVPILLFANSTLGLIIQWWTGSRQQLGRSNLAITKMLEMKSIDPSNFTNEQFKIANDIFDKFKEKEFKPANEAYRDQTRKDLDRAMLVELLGFPDSIMDSIDLLRYKWCSEPSVHGGKSTRPS